MNSHHNNIPTEPMTQGTAMIYGDDVLLDNVKPKTLKLAAIEEASKPENNSYVKSLLDKTTEADGQTKYTKSAVDLRSKFPDKILSKLYCPVARSKDSNRNKMSTTLQGVRAHFENLYRSDATSVHGSTTGFTHAFANLRIDDDDVNTTVSDVTMRSARTGFTDAMSIDTTPIQKNDAQFGRGGRGNNNLTRISEEDDVDDLSSPNPNKHDVLTEAENMSVIYQDDLLSGDEKNELCRLMLIERDSGKAALRMSISHVVNSLKEWRKNIEDAESEAHRQSIIQEKKNVIGWLFSVLGEGGP